MHAHNVVLKNTDEMKSLSIHYSLLVFMQVREKKKTTRDTQASIYFYAYSDKLLLCR